MTDDLGYSNPTFYFYKEGRVNLDKTVELVHKRIKKTKMRKVIVFTANGEGAYKLNQLINKKTTQIIAVTFPFKKPFYKKSGKDTIKEFYADTSKEEVCEDLKNNGIILIHGVMPLQDIPILGVPEDSKIRTITTTLSLFSRGLNLCIEAIIMATDSGYVEQGEEIIAFSADTAIVATGCRKEWLFHPEEGLKIKELICKPIKSN